MSHSSRSKTVVLLICLAMISRFIPHPPNFTAVNAIALFCACTLGSRAIAFCAVFATMFCSDIVIGLHSQMVSVYLSLALTILIGRTSLKTYGAIPLSSLSFFLSVNFFVWLLDGIYPMTASGLLMSYIAAIPFLTYQFAGDVFYSALLFGAYYLVTDNLSLIIKDKGQ